MKQLLLSGSRTAPTLAGRQRGFTAVFVAIAMTALLTVLVLVIDLGNLFMTKRRLEQKATMAALAGADAMSGCLGIPSTALAASVVNDSIAANTAKGESAPMMGANGNAGIITGWINTTTGSNVFTPGSPPAGMLPAVQVNLSTSSPAGLTTLLTAPSNTLVASATAQQQLLAKFMIGTDLLNLSLNPSLGPLSFTVNADGSLQSPITVPLPLSVGTVQGEVFIAAGAAPQPDPPDFLPIGTVVSSAEITIKVLLQISLPVTPPLVTANLNLGIAIFSPSAHASITNITCGSASTPVVTLTASTAVATVQVGTFKGTPSEATVLDSSADPFLTANVAGLGLVTVSHTAKLLPITVGAGAATFNVATFTAQSGSLSNSFDPTNANAVASARPCDYPSTTLNKPSATSTCFIATQGSPGTPQTVVAHDLATTLTNSLAEFLDPSNFSATAQIVPLPAVSVPLPGILSSSLSTLSAQLASPLDSIVLEPLLSELGISAGIATVTTASVVQGPAQSKTFVSP